MSRDPTPPCPPPDLHLHRDQPDTRYRRETSSDRATRVANGATRVANGFPVPLRPSVDRPDPTRVRVDPGPSRVTQIVLIIVFVVALVITFA